MSNTRNRTPDTLAEYLGCWIDESGKTQEEIAKAVGFDKPIVITLMRLGQVKVPINKIRPLAEVLGCVDPGHFLRLALIEY